MKTPIRSFSPVRRNRAGRTGKSRGATKLETPAAPAWHLPGGVRLADYALGHGFVASALLTRDGRSR